MTDAEPTPVFRRFPWVQLVFCLACLAMTAWTWMRYSYCWRMTSEEAMSLAHNAAGFRGFSDEYVELDCRKYATSVKKVRPPGPRLSIEFNGFPPGPDQSIRRGRWSPYYMGLSSGSRVVAITFTFEAASRFHGASVASLVVGAMGCFIFGLYLRRWLREPDLAA